MGKITASILVALPLLSSVTFAAEDMTCAPKEYTMALRYQQQSAK